MQKSSLKSYINFLGLISILILIWACNSMSEQILEETAGLNGGFETAQNGLPVNWLMYTPNTVPESNFKILLDTIDAKEGKQSLKFEVKSCSSAGGWRSPGFTNEFDVEGGSEYKLSCWIKNSDAEFAIKAGGVSAMSGDMKTLVNTNENFKQWKQYEFSIPVTGEYNKLRIEVNILKPGMFWIDDIKIEKK